VSRQGAAFAGTYVRTVPPCPAGAASIEVDLCPNGACPFACDYCEVARKARAFPEPIDLRLLESELRQALAGHARSAKAIVFAGSGEPTWCPQFEEALTIALACVRCLAPRPLPIHVLTCGATLDRANVVRVLEELVRSGEGEVWVKFDAWDEESYGTINGSRAFERAKERIQALGRRVPIVLYTLVARRADGEENEQLGMNLALAIGDLVGGGACIERVELTTALHPPATGSAYAITPLDGSELALVAAEISATVPVRIAGPVQSS
jgi:wyosine [tRNA(Phe)-imidazoG37] synthetase (radical SAM superfamily)